MQSVLGEVADVIRSSKSAGGVSKALKKWAKRPAAYDQIGDAIFEPAVRSDIAGQLMVFGREAKVIKLAAADGGGDNVPWIEKPWDEALAEWRARGLMSDQEFSRLLKDYAQRSDVARRLMLDQVQTIVRQHLDDAISQGRSLSQFASDVERGIEPLGLASPDPFYIKTVLVSNVQAAYGAGRYRALEDPAVQDVTQYIGYRTVGDARVTPQCDALDRLAWPIDNPAWREVAPPNHFNCFPAGTLVQGTFTAATRALYTGDLIELRTEAGNVLTVTAKHPVLTSEGFAAADSVRDGQYVLSNNRRVVLNKVGHVDPENAPARIEDAFDALLVRGNGLREIRPMPGDFYGDAAGFDGNVDVVTAKLALVNSVQSKSAYERGYARLATPPASRSCEVGGSPLVHLSVGVSAALGGLPCPAALPLNEETVGLNGGPFEQLRIGPASDVHASRYQPSLDSGSGDARFIRQLLEGYPSSVFLDKVVDVQRHSFHGYVYDLESPFGWIVASDIYTSNCRCSQSALTEDEAADYNIVDSVPEAGTPSPGFGGPPVARLNAG